MTQRSFENRPGVRERVPLLIGIDGPSGSGKTFSALRLATGMQRVTGGEIFVIDTEARRSLHYAEQFKFQHVEFKAPFSPLDYLAAIEFCVKKAAGVVIVDSMSHEHEGPGGVLEWHEREMGGDFKKQFLAWAKPKAARRRLINTILQLGVNAILCFRAKEKIRLPAKGDSDREPKEMGWMPIAGEEFVYEMTANILLYPGSGGVPKWKPTLPGERAMTKLPIQFAGIFEKEQPLSEDIGQSLALWAAGDAKTPTAQDIAALLEQVSKCDTLEEIDDLARGARQAWTPEQRVQIRVGFDERRAQIRAGSGDDPTNGFGDTPRAKDPGVTDPERSATEVAVWTTDTPSRCSECKRLRSKVPSLGHDDGCSFAGAQ